MRFDESVEIGFNQIKSPVFVLTSQILKGNQIIALKAYERRHYGVHLKIVEDEVDVVVGDFGVISQKAKVEFIFHIEKLLNAYKIIVIDILKEYPVYTLHVIHHQFKGRVVENVNSKDKVAFGLSAEHV